MWRGPSLNTFSCMADNKRTETREDAELALRLASGASGTTRDVSKSGIYFESEAEQQVGREIDFIIDFDTPSGPMGLHARGEVVRTERRGGKAGAGVKILESKFEAGPQGRAKV